MSISDREIWACANEVIGQYGDAAAFYAAQRAEALLEKCDFDGQLVWRRILRRINELDQTAPSSARLN